MILPSLNEWNGLLSTCRIYACIHVMLNFCDASAELKARTFPRDDSHGGQCLCLTHLLRIPNSNISISQSGAVLNPTHDAPTFAYGFGLPDLSAVLWFGADSSFKFDVKPAVGITHGSSHTFCYRVIAGSTIDLRATIVWTDPPGTGRDAMALINDLVCV